MKKINLDLAVTARFIINRDGMTKTSTTTLRTIIVQGLQRLRLLSEVRSLADLSKKAKSEEITEIEVNDVEFKFIYNTASQALDFDGKLVFSDMLSENGIDIEAYEGLKSAE